MGLNVVVVELTTKLARNLPGVTTETHNETLKVGEVTVGLE
jgi:hypothetical protein